MLIQLLIICLVATLVCSNEDEAPRIETPLGVISGYYKKSFKGRKYAAFDGIPYAEAPIGDLRFEEPIPISSWGLLNATVPKPLCAQYMDIAADENGHRVTEGRVTGQDDCLYLNINAPIVSDSQRKLPVVFFIHGGSYQYGSGDPFSSNNIYFTDRDVIFVSINYRVGVQGFLSTEDDVLPGNLGLKDQNLALRWVADNIVYFGGDASKVTLIGFSAGASSVQYHYLSPLSKGLFHSGIAISGTVFNPWGFTLNAAEKAKKLGALFDCPTNSSRLMVNCLKKVPAQFLAAATKEFQPWQYMPEAPFAPVVEKAGYRPFISKSPKELMATNKINDAPIVFGVVSEEGCDPGAAYAPHDNILKELNDNWLTLAPHLLQYNYTLSKKYHRSAAIAVRQKYFGYSQIDKSKGLKLINLLNDAHYFIGIEKGVRLQAQASKSPVYFYYYSYRSSYSRSDELSHTKNDYGVCHCDDLLLVFNTTDFPPSRTEKEFKMMNFMMDMWETVATHGVPKLDVEWKPVNATDPEIKYLQIHGPENYSMSGDSNFGQKNFWRNFFYLP